MNATQNAKHLSQSTSRLALTDTELQSMARVLGISDETILQRLRELGLNEQTARLLWLLPSLEVAWADGYVSQPESELLSRAAQSRAAVTAASAQALWQQWLQQHPSEGFFQQARLSIHDILAQLQPADRALLKQDLLAHCKEIMTAERQRQAGRKPLNTHERAVIRQLAATL